MSLVAYGSSDDSEQSDAEDYENRDSKVHSQTTPEVARVGNNTVDDQFSDSDTEVPNTSRKNGESSLDNRLKGNFMNLLSAGM